jgi:hypothetical protein
MNRHEHDGPRSDIGSKYPHHVALVPPLTHRQPAANRSASRSASCLSPHARASSEALAHVGTWSGRGGRGAEAFIVAIERYSRSASA